MGICATLKKPNRPDEADHDSVPSNIQSDFQVRQPQCKCISNFPVQYLCGNLDCQAEEAYFCDQSACQSCPKKHEGCQRVKIAQVTKLLQKRCELHKDFVAKIALIENQMIQQMKAQGRARIQKMLLLGINPDQAKVVQALYFNNEEAEVTQEFTADLLEQMKNSENVVTNEDKLLEQYRKDAERMLDNLKEMGEKSINKRTSQMQQQLNASKIKQYGYADITKKLMRIPAHRKPKIKQITINNTCQPVLSQAQNYSHPDVTIVPSSRKGHLMKGSFADTQLVLPAQQRRKRQVRQGKESSNQWQSNRDLDRI